MIKTFLSARYGERIGFVVMMCGVAFLAFAGAMFGINAVNAANPFAIQFPVAELGNCGSMEECRVYCDNPANGEACLSFAEKNGFVAKDDAARARKVIEKPGPGGCRGEACRTYCETPEHSNECIDFAEKEGFMSKEQAGEARKQSALMNEPGPGGCKGEGECRNYCDDPAHLDECLDFGVKKGFMNAEEAARIRKISGNGPGGCKNKKECDVYCQSPEHGEECIAFAVENGFMPKEEAERARQMINKTGPGGCRGEACRTYCDDPAHQEECIDFAVKEGMMPKEEAERAKKFAQATKEAGPGGCKGQQECGRYCGDPAHGEECFAFAKTNGLVRPEEERRHEQSRGLNQKVQESGGPGGCKDEGECMQYCGDPSHVNECIDFAEKSGMMSREDAQKGLDQFREHREFGERVRAAGPEQFSPGPPGGFQGGPGFGPRPGGFGPPQGGPGMPDGFGPGQSGPGFGPAFGGQPGFQGQDGQFAGPGGCASPEECVDFCAKPENRESCIATFRRGMPPPQRMEPQQGQGGMMPQGEFLPPGNFPQGTTNRPDMSTPCTTPEECKAMEEQFRARMPQGGFMPPREGERSGEFSGGSGEFRGQPGEFPGRGPEGNTSPVSPARPMMPPADMNPEEFMREFQQKAERGEIQSGRFMQGGPINELRGGTMEPPREGTPGEFQRPPMTGKRPLIPQGGSAGSPQGEFMPPQGNFAPPSGGFTPPSQSDMMPPVPEVFGGFSPAGGLSPMPMSAPMPPSGEGFAPPPMVAPAPESFGGFVSPPMPRETSAPMPATAPMPAPVMEAQPSPPPPPPTSQLKAQSFIGLLYEAVRELIAR